MTKDEVIKNLKALAVRFKDKKYITLKEIRSIPKLGYYVQFHFRKLGNALQAASLPSSKLAASMNIKNEDLLNYLRDLNNKLGNRPRVWDIYDDKEVYKKYSDNKLSWTIFKTRFGGFTKAIDLIETKKRNEPQDTRPILTQKKSADDADFFYEKNKFWGEAAELHVTAELLYRGFQAANIPVDEGLDVLAVKKNKTFYFQVKHKDLTRSEPIKLTKSSFERSGSGNVYYIFVLLSDKKRDFLIIPFHMVNDWIRTGHAEDKDKNYQLHIKKVDGNYKLKEIDLSKYLDRWEDIK